MITITDSAQEYLAELLSKQEDALGVRVFINDPGTPRAETCIAYGRADDLSDDNIVPLTGWSLTSLAYDINDNIHNNHILVQLKIH